MSFRHYHDPRTLQPLQVVILATFSVVLGGGFLLLSAAESQTLVDGAAPWQENSPLRAVVQLLCLNYEFPTYYAGEIKSYLLCLGAGVGLLAIAIAILARDRGQGEEPVAGGLNGQNRSGGTDAAVQTRRRTGWHIAPLAVAQAAFALYLLWSFASVRWSQASDLAWGGSVLLTMYLLWSFVLGHGLGPVAARMAARIVIVLTALTAGVALWYYYGRNWTLRAKFPFGNPNFLSVCLIPGMLLAIGRIMEMLARADHDPPSRRAFTCAVSLTTLGLAGWAFMLADSRGPLLGLFAGLIAMVFFAFRGWSKLAPLLLGLTIFIAAGAYMHARRNEPQSGGRDATLRFREYAWSYAVRLFREQPFHGHGQGGYACRADQYTDRDVLLDPLVLSARVDHAHNEWLEVLADLGGVGLLLLATGLVLTLIAGGAALSGVIPLEQRWTLIALLGTLSALIVSETFGVGLRTPDVPTAFFSMLGLIWALTNRPSTNMVVHGSTSRARRLLTGAVLGTGGVLCLVLAGQDFQSARDAFRVDQELHADNNEAALAHALRATNQLSPQRALTNLYRLAETRARIARDLLARAADRERRARQAEFTDRTLLALAATDRAESEQQTMEASRALKELITRSPGFLNHGLIEYRLNLMAADHAAARGEDKQRDLALRNAHAAIERELRRQPFDPVIALFDARLSVPEGEPAELIAVLARPLRHHRLTREYLDFLPILADPANPEALPNQLRADPAVDLLTLGEPKGQIESWRPERLRLAAAYWFDRGRFDTAADLLAQATREYMTLGPRPPLGAACALAELADARFFAHPGNALDALHSAAEAQRVAPDSMPGRDLRAFVDQRRIDYWLAAGQEDEARQWLSTNAPSPADESSLVAELADRYRRLADSLLRSRWAQLDGSVPAEFLKSLENWLTRSLELQADAAARLSLAYVHFFQGRDPDAAAQLMMALNDDLNPDAVRRFLQTVRDRNRDPSPYAVLRNRVPDAPND